MKKKVKAIGLVSGGLDSALAVAILREQGIELQGLYFSNGFSASSLRRHIYNTNSLEREAQEMSKSLGLPVEGVDISEEYLDLLVSPQHGYGANVNPCIDCRIFMLGKAREYMEKGKADFVFTGEVLGQRPMSQHKSTMDMIERESGLLGLLLRPLSAKLLPPTIPEKEGWVMRENLLDIQGRSRKRQMELAGKLRIEEYMQPAGGCMLTDRSYARKFKDLMSHRDTRAITREEAVLLSVGRHFRLSRGVKIVVGRKEAENLYLENCWSDSWLATAVDYPGPTVLIQGCPDEEELRVAAAITARYSDAKHLGSVGVVIKKGTDEEWFEAVPAEDEDIDRCRI